MQVQSEKNRLSQGPRVKATVRARLATLMAISKDLSVTTPERRKPTGAASVPELITDSILSTGEGDRTAEPRTWKDAQPHTRTSEQDLLWEGMHRSLAHST